MKNEVSILSGEDHPVPRQSCLPMRQLAPHLKRYVTKGEEMRDSIKKCIFVAAILLGLFSHANAGTTIGKVTHIFSGPYFGTKVFIALDSPINDKAACSTNSLYTFGFDSSDPGASTWMSMLSIAYTAEKTVYVEGYGGTNCSHWSNIEDLKTIRLQ